MTVMMRGPSVCVGRNRETNKVLMNFFFSDCNVFFWVFCAACLLPAKYSRHV